MKRWRVTMVALAAILSMVGLPSCGTKKQVVPPPSTKKMDTPKEAVAPVPQEPALPAGEAYEYVDVNFDYDRYGLSAAAQRILTEHAKALLKATNATVRIEGHCDERGTVEYNLSLGEKRANAVKAFLVQYGVPSAGITTISYGKERPKDTRHSEAGWAINRRAEIHLIR